MDYLVDIEYHPTCHCTYMDVITDDIRCLRRVLDDNSVSAKFELTSADYEATKILEEGEDITFTAFAPAVFATFRTAFGISRAEFLEDVGPLNKDIKYLRSVLTNLRWTRSRLIFHSL